MSVNDRTCFNTVCVCVCIQIMWFMRPMICVCRYEQFLYHMPHMSVGVHCVARYSLKNIAIAHWPATYMSLRHSVLSHPSFLLKQKHIICFTLFLGYHSKEIPRHHCKHFRWVFFLLPITLIFLSMLNQDVTLSSTSS